MSNLTPETLFFGYTNDNKDLLKELITYDSPLVMVEEPYFFAVFDDFLKQSMLLKVLRNFKKSSKMAKI